MSDDLITLDQFAAWVKSKLTALSAETQQRERFEEEVECAHKWLDDQGIPRADIGGEVFSLVGRMMQLREPQK